MSEELGTYFAFHTDILSRVENEFTVVLSGRIPYMRKGSCPVVFDRSVVSSISRSGRLTDGFDSAAHIWKPV